jgi:NAD(P)-dependent dehydrogenase (short-subunit alcohol dehydrogenase family)
MSLRVVITAGAAGIGRAMAERFLADGGAVALCDADAQAVADFAADHPGALARVADVTDPVAMDGFFDAVDAAWPDRIDVVCANAGIGGPAGRIEDLALEDWRACLAVNLDGAFLTCRWAARRMRAQGAGLIVLTASTAGIAGYPFRSPYATAKWGIVGLTKTLAMELGPAGVRVNALAPGAVEGPRMDRVVAKEAAARAMTEDEIRALYVRGVSLRSWVTAADVAAMAAFLASPAAAKISGQVMCIDGHTETLSP